MPAPDYETIYAIEDTIEPEVCSVLETATGLASSAVLRWLSDEDAQATPRLEVELRVGSPAGIKHKDADGFLRHAAWNCDLVVRIITHRDRDTSATHYTLIKQARAAIEGWQSDYTSLDLPYHAIKRMVWSSTTNSIDNRETITELGFDTAIQVRDDAWPV